MLLSIVIPTYNRNDIILANIERLLVQMRDRVELIILDNSSFVPVEDTLAVILDRYSHHDVKVYRNKINIGANANILRSFEFATAEWLWILGDDDVVSKTAIDDILKTIKEHREAVFINFSTEIMRKKGLRAVSYDTCGVEDFAERLDYAGNINFMSVSVWRVEPVKGKINISYHYAYSMSATFVLLLSVLGVDNVCYYSNCVLIEEATLADYVNRWRFRDFILGWNTILELPMSAKTRSALALKMISWHRPENVAAYLLADAVAQNVGSFYYDIAVHRLAPYLGVGTRLRFLIYRILFIWPHIGWSIVKRVIKLAVKYGYYGVDLRDIEGRSS